MAKKKTRRKKTRRYYKGQKVMTPWGKATVVGAVGVRRRKKSSTKRRRRNPVLGSLGRKDSGTTRSHKPLKVLEKRLSRLSKIVAARKKNPAKWK